MTDDNRELVIKAKSGDMQARNELIIKNMGLIRKTAAYFKCRSMQFEDLINEGTFGMIKAIEKFDLNQNIKFSTYAVWWIRHSILRAVENKDLVIRIPVHLIEEARYGTDFESKVSKVYAISSLDVPVSEYTNDVNHTDSVSELLTDEFDIEDHYNKSELIRLVRVVVSQLPEKEKFVIRSFYGIQRPRKSSKEIAADIGKSFQRVNQIKERAIKRIREEYSYYFDGYAV